MQLMVFQNMIHFGSSFLAELRPHQAMQIFHLSFLNYIQIFSVYFSN